MLKGTPMQSGGTICGSNLRKTGSVLSGPPCPPPSSKNKPQPKLERPFSIFYLRFSIPGPGGPRHRAHGPGCGPSTFLPNLFPLAISTKWAQWASMPTPPLAKTNRNRNWSAHFLFSICDFLLRTTCGHLRTPIDTQSAGARWPQFRWHLKVFPKICPPSRFFDPLMIRTI